MIVIALPAHMKCVEEGCSKTAPVEICLTTTGGFGFKPSEPTWQVLTNPQQIGGPYLCKCPEHHKVVSEARLQVGPSGPRVRVGH